MTAASPEQPAAEPEYYILSLKYSVGASCVVLLWWRPKNSGYTMFLEAAGRYTHSEVTGKPGYYNDGEATLAIPCHEVEALAHRAVDVDHKYALIKLAPLARVQR